MQNSTSDKKLWTIRQPMNQVETQPAQLNPLRTENRGMWRLAKGNDFQSWKTSWKMLLDTTARVFFESQPKASTRICSNLAATATSPPNDLHEREAQIKKWLFAMRMKVIKLAFSLMALPQLSRQLEKKLKAFEYTKAHTTDNAMQSKRMQHTEPRT